MNERTSFRLTRFCIPGLEKQTAGQAGMKVDNAGGVMSLLEQTKSSIEYLSEIL